LKRIVVEELEEEEGKRKKSKQRGRERDPSSSIERGYIDRDKLVGAFGS
jgi:hypothetical protein